MKQLDNASIDTTEVSTILKALRKRGIFSPICKMDAAMASFAYQGRARRYCSELPLASVDGGFKLNG